MEGGKKWKRKFERREERKIGSFGRMKERERKFGRREEMEKEVWKEKRNGKGSLEEK